MFDLSAYVPVILSALVGVLIVAVVLAWRALGQWSKSNAVRTENNAWSQVRTFIYDAVRAANQMLAESTGEEKLSYVLSVVDRLYPDLDEEVVRAIVEAAVFQEKEWNEKEAV